jgi:hypothetical protein
MAMRVSAGQAGLKLSASLQDAESQVEITWTNESASPCLLNVGGLLGTMELYDLTLVVSGGEVSGRKNASIGRSGAIEGRLDPWVVFMPPGAAYSVRASMDSIRLNRSGKSLSSLKGPWTLTIQYKGEPAVDFAPGKGQVPYSLTRNGPTSIRFCEGVLTAGLEHK